MAMTVNTHEAKTQLSRLLALVEKGEEVVIARNGKAVAKLVPAARPSSPFQFGSMRGQIKLLPGWDDPMTPEEWAAWYEGPVFPETEENGLEGRPA
jgi:prevent-host-death family protein